MKSLRRSAALATRYLVVASMAGTALVFESGTAQASNACGPWDHSFDGFASLGGPGATTSGQPIEGSAAQLTTRFAHVCDSDNSTAWTMIAGANGAGGYAQSGFYDHVNNSYPPDV